MFVLKPHQLCYKLPLHHAHRNSQIKNSHLHSLHNCSSMYVYHVPFHFSLSCKQFKSFRISSYRKVFCGTNGCLQLTSPTADSIPIWPQAHLAYKTIVVALQCARKKNNPKTSKKYGSICNANDWTVKPCGVTLMDDAPLLRGILFFLHFIFIFPFF